MRFTKILTTAFGLLTFGSLYSQSEDLKKLNTFYYYIESLYVDSIDGSKIVDDAIVSMLADLDPHSVYIPKEDLQAKNEPLVGNFEGVGVQFNLLHDTISVVAAVIGGPSEAVGIRAGDKIITIDGDTCAGVGWKNKDVFDHLRGKKGTKVDVGIKRKGEPQLLDFTITRDKIPIYSVDATYMLDKHTGYLKLTRFAAQSMAEINTGLQELQSQGMENLVLDLRGNGGGYLNVAFELANTFLNKGQLIVYTEGTHQPRQDKIAPVNGSFNTGKVVVLIDEGSASASEIVSGALQDWDRGLIIGRRSFGKGLVQKQFNLPDYSAIRLTIARYHTPTGRCIQKEYDKGLESYHKDVLNRYKSGELFSQDSIEFPDSLKYETLINHRTVYGGGGIMPDIFIPLDTTQGSTYYGQLIRKGVFNEFYLDYLDENRAQLLSNYPTIDSFKNNFYIDQNMIDELIAYGTENEVEFNQEEFNTSKALINESLKALIARGLYGTTAYYQIINENDPAIIEALERIDDNTFKKLNLTY